jgi:malonyl-CoA/methylmalonyl-CoA synthetase
VLALPLFHMHGLGVGLHGTLLSGAPVVPATIRSGAVLDARRPNGRHSSSAYPPCTTAWPLGTRPANWSALRLCVGLGTAARRRPPAHASEGGVTVLERYGLTETLMNSSNPYDGERRAGTVGFALPGVEIRLGAGDEILVRGPNVFGGYWGLPDASRAVLDADGWFATGDVGAFDEDGYLSIVGRSKELIISGGYNVYPREVEDVLRAYPGVTDCAVVGTPSDEWGELVTAVVVANGPVDPDALLEYAAGELAPYKRPRAVRFVDELPRNALGKILRNEL